MNLTINDNFSALYSERIPVITANMPVRRRKISTADQDDDPHRFAP